MSAEELLARDFGTLADVIREQAKALKDKPALAAFAFPGIGFPTSCRQEASP